MSEANRHAESYVEEQMQNSLDYCAQNLQQVRDLVLDVQVLQDQLLTDHEELGRSLGDKISTLSAEMDTVKSDTAAVSSAVTVEAAARSEEIATLRLQVGSLGETFTQRLQIMQSAATEQSGAGIAEVASKCAEICTNLEDLSTRLGAVESQKLELGVQLSQIHAAIGEGQTALDSRGAQVVTLSQSLEAQESAWREATDSLAGQLQRLTEHSNSKLTGLRGDVDTLKEDLAGHIAFTSECFGDQQSVLEEKFTQVNGDLEAQVQAHHELQSLFTELDAFATQVSCLYVSIYELICA